MDFFSCLLFVIVSKATMTCILGDCKWDTCMVASIVTRNCRLVHHDAFGCIEKTMKTDPTCDKQTLNIAGFWRFVQVLKDCPDGAAGLVVSFGFCLSPSGMAYFLTSFK